MGASLSTLFAGALVLGVISVANADEPIMLSTDQLDNVTAGEATQFIKSPGNSGNVIFKTNFFDGHPSVDAIFGTGNGAVFPGP